MRSIIAIFFMLHSAMLCAQAIDPSDAEAEPKGGEALVTIVYYRIDFTQEQLEYLRTHEAELIFSVSDKGKAVLEKVNDIDNRAVIDSMMRVSHQLPEFFPKISNGRAVNAVYFMKLAWPHYEQLLPQQQQPFQPMVPYMMTPFLQPGPIHKKKLDEFESYTYLYRYDMTFGGLTSSPMGNMANYSQGSGGIRFDCMFFGSKGWGGGFSTFFISNRRIRPYPGTSLSSLSSRMPSTFFSFNVGKVLERKAGDILIQFEPAFVMQELLSYDNFSSGKPNFLMGFSPGVSIHYALGIGPGHMNQYYYFPTAIRNYVNFHVAARPMVMNLNDARGVMMEAGISYRLALKHVRDYKLR
jgi:hypothetical protein